MNDETPTQIIQGETEPFPSDCPELRIAYVELGKVRMDIFKSASVNDLRRAQNFLSKIIVMIDEEDLARHT